MITQENTFKQSLETIRTFNYATIEKITEFSKSKGFEFSDRTLRSMQSELTTTPNLNAMNGVASFYRVTKSFLLDGKPQNDELHGFIEIDKGGCTAFLVSPVLESLVDYLCHFEPSMNKEMEWECYEERGYEPDDHNSLEDNLKLEGNKYPQYKIKFNGVVVGLALSEDKALWIESRLNKCAKHCLEKLPKQALKYLVKLT